ncbi:MAG: transposase [Alphaproteobacteria bacterium]|uniref:Transposase n=1 Tax=Candidatus Nitrobium versatile TaxID=2884831 RepID=A0A953J521_9BACT|nr:transposase [Candidatus Nitrobium versatile]
MPRVERGLADNAIYHVINRGNGRQEVFHKEEDYEAFLLIMQEAKTRYSVKVFAYCLMPNHFHLAVKPAAGGELSRWMQWLMTSHVRRYHRHYGSSGHVWQGRYKSFMVQEDSHLLVVLRYIEGNPVRAKLVQTATEWQWSSHNETLGKAQRMLTDKVPLELPEEWDRYVDTPFYETDLDCLRRSVNRQAPFGDAEWQMEKCKEFGLESTLNRRGRPRKEEK